MPIRKPAVAGRFYTDNPADMRAQVAELLRVERRHQSALAVMVPHAGWLYSGRCAGKVLGAIDVPSRCIVIGPNHTGLGAPVSVWCEGSWSIPGGSVPIDGELASRVLASHPKFESDTRAHLREHAVEVELPLLMAMNSALQIVPIIMKTQRKSVCLELGRALAEVVREYPEPVLLVVSSDMSHFIPASLAADLDGLALRQMQRLDPEGLYDVVLERQISMCGVVPATVIWEALRVFGASEVELVDYTHSGIITGDHSSVVAYAGLIAR